MPDRIPMKSVFLKPSGSGVQLTNIKCFNSVGGQIAFSTAAFEGTILFTSIASASNSWETMISAQGLVYSKENARFVDGAILTVVGGSVDVFASDNDSATKLATFNDGETFVIGDVPTEFLSQLGTYRSIQVQDDDMPVTVGTTSMLVFGGTRPLGEKEWEPHLDVGVTLGAEADAYFNPFEYGRSYDRGLFNLYEYVDNSITAFQEGLQNINDWFRENLNDQVIHNDIFYSMNPY